MVLARQTGNLLLIHFDAQFPVQQLMEAPKPSADEPCEVFDQLEWYCQWAAERAGAVYALVPHYLKDQTREIERHLGIPLIWYTDELDLKLPDTLRGISQVWMINGNDLPLIDWQSAREETRRTPSDVIVFGRRGFSSDGHYPETVLVDSADRVIRFRRHYFDSPAFADRWGGSASFLAASPRLAHSVANHVLVRGWGLESIGAMTRRFQVRWSSAPCLQAAFADENERIQYLDHALAGAGASTLAAASGSDIEKSGTIRGGFNSMSDLSPSARTSVLRSRANSAMGDSGVHAHDEFMRSTILQTGSRNLSMDDLMEPEVGGDPIYLLGKRVMDIVCSIVGIIALSPLLLTVAALVKLTSRGPVLFGHKRQGLGGKEFRCWKFRSMKLGADKLQDTLRELNEVDGPQFKITADPRITRIGGWLRRTNIDELPQLINVVLGTMSLVGPRPSPDNENQMCPAWRRSRLSVKPGITGLWQVLRLRDDPSADFQEWIYYDVEYAKHRSLWLDLQLLLNTPIAILTPKRIPAFACRLHRFGICLHSRQKDRVERVVAGESSLKQAV